MDAQTEQRSADHEEAAVNLDSQNASTGAAALPTACASTEAQAPATTVAESHAIQNCIASTPMTMQNAFPVHSQAVGWQRDISPPRTRLGTVRVEKPRKRARPAQTNSIGDTDNAASSLQVRWGTSSSNYVLNTPQSISTSNDALLELRNQPPEIGLRNQHTASIFQQQSLACSSSQINCRPLESTRYSFANNVPTGMIGQNYSHQMHATTRSSGIFMGNLLSQNTACSGISVANAFAPNLAPVFSITGRGGGDIFPSSCAQSRETLSNRFHGGMTTASLHNPISSSQIFFGNQQNGFQNLGARPSQYDHTLPQTSFHNPTNFSTASLGNQPYGPNFESDITLSTSHISARHVMSKDLPIFSGNPEEWPVFITNFQQSTERCGFTNQENLIRLQKCLKGQALEAVRGKLMMPSTVPFALETLRMLYGRADIIQQTLQVKLRQYPEVRMNKMETLINFALAVQNYRTTMQAIGLENYLNDPMLLNDLLTKLPYDLKLDWGRYRLMHHRVDIIAFDEWLFALATCASQVQPLVSSSAVPSRVEEKKGGRKQQREILMTHDIVGGDRKLAECPKCRNNHLLADCSEFLAMKKEVRWDFVRKEKLCIRCFKQHFVRNCNSKKRCGVDGCQMAHNPLLHTIRKISSDIQAKTVNQSDVTNQTTSSVLCHLKDSRRTLFRYIPVTLFGKHGAVNVYAFADEGSACTLIERGLSDELGLDGPQKELCLQWTGDITQNEIESKMVRVKLSAQDSGSEAFYLENARTVSKLNLPLQSLDQNDISERGYLKNIPVSPYEAVRARILIGLDNIKLCVPLEIRQSEEDNIIAVRCKLGWSVFGRNNNHEKASQRVMHVCDCNNSSRLDELLQSYFSLESIGIRAVEPLVSKEDERSLRIMESTTKYLPNEKRWETGLLWKADNIKLPDSFQMARRRLQCLEAKMVRDPDLKQFLITTLAEYERKGYVRKLGKHDYGPSDKSWYIPIFTVTNVNKNKTRLVWDAAAAVNNTSLNSFLMKGPDFTKSLVGILIRFREKPIALCGDIREMYHQVLVTKDDQAAQRFLWRGGDTTRDPDTYVMQVMTFGASCSPSSANYVKNKNAERFHEQHPTAVNAIIENTFVDDWLQSAHTEEEMIQLASTVRSIHSDGGFEMRSWKSNSTAVLHALSGHSKQEYKSIENPGTYQEKVLGMWWSSADDVLTFSEKFSKEIFRRDKTPTKREILRAIMTIFDPLGLLGFYLVYAKVLMQEIWRSGVKWDEPIKAVHEGKWEIWLGGLRTLSNVRVPRCYSLVSSSERVELHVFVDASIDAYAAVAYLRAKGKNEFACSLVASKTRVAPLKPISVPRLELMAAILGLRLAKFLSRELSVSLVRRFFWSDSKNVLYWIQSDARKFQQFVAVRVGEILQDSLAEEWRWVPTSENVADEGTKWSKEPILDSDTRWFKGPYFLTLPENEWPKGNLNEESEPVFHIELKRRLASTLKIISPDPHRFSKWERLINTQGYVLRFLNKYGLKALHSSNMVNLLTKVDIEGYEYVVIRNCQEEMYYEEISCLLAGESISPNSPVYKCSPYLDQYGILRVRGRIDAVEGVSFSVKRPTIMPRHHQVTRLIADFYHRKFHHHHNEIVVNEMRQRYWIQGLRALIKDTAKNCQRCRNNRATSHPPEMGDLPVERLQTFNRPFTNIGIDYFGPIEVVIGRRREKRWGVLFTCLTVRAVHIELASSLSTDCFLLALKLFVSRRGVPACIWSDNGTNFRGASRMLENEMKKLLPEELEMRRPDIKWKFIPPASPHMGGCWERMVRSVKSVLMDILPLTHLREDILRASLAEVEFILNSRPLTYVPLDSPEAEAITPNHFLLGSSNGEKKFSFDEADNLSLNKNLRVCGQVADHFWKRWLREYLPWLTRRTKWFDKSTDHIRTGNVVIIVDENAKRNTWKRGIVVDINQSADGEVRSAVIKTSEGLYTRPVVKLAKLDVLGEPRTAERHEVHGRGYVEPPSASSAVKLN